MGGEGMVAVVDALVVPSTDHDHGHLRVLSFASSLSARMERRAAQSQPTVSPPIASDGLPSIRSMVR